MKVVIAGSSGFLGTALRHVLADAGHEVVRLVRREAGAGESTWDPYAGTLDQVLIDGADVVVNLAGSPTAGNPHSKKWARELRESRLTTTRVLADAVSRSVAAGGLTAYVAGNGISYYGDHGDEPLYESADSRGDSLLTDLARDWQAATAPAANSGARVCVLRTAPVIAKGQPPFQQLALTTRLGLGAKLGDGGQYFPIISLRDWVGATAHLVTSKDASGPHNLCCPVTPTNAQFTDALASALHRKARLRIPAAVLSKAAGEMAPEVLGSVRAVPRALLDEGYVFRDNDAAAVIATALRD